MIMAFERRKIGEILVELGAMAPAEVRLALERQIENGGRFGDVAIAEGLVSDVLLAQALAEQFGQPLGQPLHPSRKTGH